jgi:hypothetical protein
MEVQSMSITFALDRVNLRWLKQESTLYPKPEALGFTAQFL